MKKFIVILILSILLLPFHALSANKMYWATCLTGGGDCLDGINGSSLTAGDGGIVVLSESGSDKMYVYRLQASGATAASPSVISPLTNPGTKRWHIVRGPRSESTVTVCASDSINKNCDYIATGTDDQTIINAAINAVSPGGRVVLSDGTFYINNVTAQVYGIYMSDTNNNFNVTLEGQGMGHF